MTSFNEQLLYKKNRRNPKFKDYTKEDLENHRFQNFTGTMLQHHSMQSTKYMARWIEEKNK